MHNEESKMEKDENRVLRKEIRFTGSVQGVGFRYRAQYAANGCGVKGWVKNEDCDKKSRPAAGAYTCRGFA